MLSRHFLRAKVLQVLYAAKNSNYDENTCTTLLENQIKSFNRLSLYQIAALIETHKIAERVLDEASKKFRPTEADLNPSRRFVDNQFILKLSDNFDLQSQMKAFNVHWDDAELFRRLFLTLRASKDYASYVAKEESTFDDDKKIALILFKLIMNDDVLRDQFAERDLLWEDDFDQVAQYSFMLLRQVEEQFDASSQLMMMSDDRSDTDREAHDFAVDLLRRSHQLYNESVELIKKHLNGWEFERVAVMDVLMLDMAIAEFVGCPSIPERVTIDEYIELSKEFSTERSKLFINGILDRILTELRLSGRVQKSGRGIYDPDMLNNEITANDGVYNISAVRRSEKDDDEILL